mmetsp:Transcript_7620/g.22493  ORF Transcript_7620/g.22493 Transcript_7620/m.22493 type:complete len:596 (+) Transcript_7620:1342-3129(+)
MSSDASAPLLGGNGAGGALSNPDAKTGWAYESKVLMALSGPAIFQLAGQQGLVVTNQIIVGHVGAVELAAAAIGITIFNLLFYFLLGVTSALDTLGSQAFGSGDRFGLMTWTTTATIVMTLLGVVMSGAIWFADQLAIYLFRQPHHIAAMVGVYCRWMIPGLLPFIWSLVIMKALQAQCKMWPPAVITGLSAVVNVPVNLVLINLFGFEGAAAAFSATRIIMFLMLLAYVACCGTSCLSVTDPDDEAPVSASGKGPTLWKAIAQGCKLQTIQQFWKLGLPGGAMMAADASSFDVTTAFAGALGTVELDAHTAMLTLCVFLFISFPFGVATASTIRVGNLLGAGLGQQARLSGMVCVCIGTGFLTLAGLCIFIWRDTLGYLFVNDAEVVKMVAAIAPIAAVYQFPDGILGCIGGVLRGMGRQAYLMAFNLIGFWGFGVVLGFTLAFKANYGLRGLWWGIDTGVVVTAILCVITMLRVDWDKEALKAAERLRVVSALQEAEQADLEAMAGEPEGVHLLSARQKEGIREFARQRSMQINPHPHHHSRHPNTPAGSMSRAVSFGTNLQDQDTPAAVLSGSYYGSMTLRDPITSAFGGRH